MPDPVPPTFGDLPDQYARQVSTDALVQQTRDATSPAISNQRAVPRLSIAELNSMDLADVKVKYQSTRFDNRGPVTRFLDLLDLPRNTIANIIFPGIASEQKEAGETGAFGMGKVSFSDALKSMGVTNRIALGVGGFAGDVLMDPLTYLGPAGWGAEGVSAAGRAAQVGKTGLKAIDAAHEAALAGRAVAEPGIAAYLTHAGLGTTDIAALRAGGQTEAQISQRLAEALHGSGQTRFNRYMTAIGEDAHSTEGILGKADPFGVATTDAEKGMRQGAMDFVASHGPDVKPGIRIGPDRVTGKLSAGIFGEGEVGNIASGSTIIHIPFTELGVHVPGITNAAKYGVVAGELSRAKEATIDDARLNDGLSLYDNYAKSLSQLKDNHNALAELDAADHAAGHQPAIDAGLGIGTNPDLRAHLTAQNSDLVKHIGFINEEIGKAFGEHATEVAQGLTSPGQVLAYGRLNASFAAATDKFKADMLPLMSENKAAVAAWREIRGLAGTRAEKVAAQGIEDAESIRKAKADAYAQSWRDEAVKNYDTANYLRQRGDEIAAPYKDVVHGLEDHPAPGRDIPVSGTDGSVAGSAGSAAGDVGKAEPVGGTAVREPPKARRAKTDEFSRSGVKDKLVKKSDSIPELRDLSLDRGRLMDMAGLSEGDTEGLADTGFGQSSGAFKGPYPKDLKEYLNSPAGRRDPRTKLLAQNTGKSSHAEETYRNLAGEDPETFLAYLHGRTSEGSLDLRMKALRENAHLLDPEADFLFGLQDRLEGFRQAKIDASKKPLPSFVIDTNPGEKSKWQIRRGGKYGTYKAVYLDEGKILRSATAKYANLADALIEHPPADLAEILTHTTSARQKKAAVVDWLRTHKPEIAPEVHAPPKPVMSNWKPPAIRVIDNPHDVLNPGTTFKSAGLEYAVDLDEAGQKIIVDPTGKIHYLAAFDTLPIDKDTLDLSKQIIPKTAEELRAEQAAHDFGEVAPPHASSGPLESEAAAAMQERKIHHDLADKLEAHAREHMKVADEVASGKAAETHADFLDSNPHADDPVAQANWNYLRQRYGELPHELLKPVDKEGIIAQATRDALLHEKLGLDHTKQWLLDASPETMQAKGDVADFLHEQLKAAANLSAAIKAPLAQTMTGTAQNLVKAAEMALGVDPGTIGANAFMPVANAVSGIFGDKFDAAARDLAYGAGKALRVVFGEKAGMPHELTRMAARETRNGGDTMNAVMIKLSGELRSLMAKHKIDSSKFDELGKQLEFIKEAIHQKNGAVYAVDDPVWDGIKALETNGLFDEKIHPGFRAQMEGMAHRIIQDEKTMAESEQRAGILGQVESDYAAHVKTREAAQAINTSKANFPNVLSASSRDSAGRLIESFQQAKTTLRQKVLDKDGKEIGWFMLGERDTANAHNAEDLKYLMGANPVKAKGIQAKKDLIEAFDAAKAADSLSQPNPERLSKHFINQLAQTGAFSTLTNGKELSRGLFETNAILNHAARTGAHERARVRMMMDAMVDMIGMPNNDAKLISIAQDAGQTKVLLANGVEGRLIHAQAGRPMFIEIGNQRWRYPDAAAIGQSSHDVLGIKNSKFQRTLVPEHVAEALENVYRATATPDDIHDVLKAIDTMTSAWKGVTLSHPSWTIGNISGAIIQMLSMGISPAQMVRYAMPMARVAFHGHDAEALAKVAIEGRFGTLTGPEIMEHARGGRIINAGTSNEAAGTILMGSGQMKMPNEYSLFRNPKLAALEMHGHAKMLEDATVYGGIASKVPYHKQLGYLKGLVMDEAYANRMLKPWFGVNGRIEDWSRLIAYAALRDKGHDTSSATAKIIEGMFDFSDLTNVEQSFFRRLLPFYAWTRNSAAYGIKQLFENPKYHTMVPKVKDALEEFFAGEQKVPDHARPRWMREQLAIQVGADPDTRSALLVGSYLPQEGGMRLGAGLASPVLGQAALQDGISYLGMGINPLFRVPLEVAAGRELYTGRVISGDENQGDLTVGEHLLNQVRPFRELGVGNVREGALQSAFGRSPAEGVERLLVGGRSQPFTTDRLASANMREYTDRVANIRKKITLAVREKNQKASLKARVSLLQTYAAMKKANLKIPRWAEKQLPMVAN